MRTMSITAVALLALLLAAAAAFRAQGQQPAPQGLPDVGGYLERQTVKSGGHQP